MPVLHAANLREGVWQEGYSFAVCEWVSPKTPPAYTRLSHVLCRVVLTRNLSGLAE